MGRRWLMAVLSAGLLALLAGAPSALGQVGATCPALVEKALAEMTDNCGGLGRNSACYGYNRVDATFAEESLADSFSVPADQAALVALQTIQTAPLDVDQERWGIAVMNVQANVPNSLPGQGVVFLLLGDVTVENAVPPEQAFVGAPPLDVTTLTPANLRSSPTTRANIVASIPAGAPLQADGLSPDKAWLRVLYEAGPAWVSRELVSSEAGLDALPVISRENRSPMQAFYFSASVGQSTCNEVPPSTLVVQGPQGVKVDINANGADIRVGSTVALWLTPDGRMQLLVLSGSVQIGDLVIPAGFTIFLPLSEDGRSPAGGWEGLRPMTQEELDSLKTLELIGDEILNYRIVLPTPEDIQQTLTLLNLAASGGQGAQGAADPQCAGLRLTSPLGVAPYGELSFYWDPISAPGVTYRMSAFNDSRAPILSRETTATSVVVDTALFGDLRASTLFYWQVEALLDGEPICSTGQVAVLRTPDPSAPPLPTPATGPVCGNGILEPGEGCGGPYECFADNGGC